LRQNQFDFMFQFIYLPNWRHVYRYFWVALLILSSSPIYAAPVLEGFLAPSDYASLNDVYPTLYDNLEDAVEYLKRQVEPVRSPFVTWCGNAWLASNYGIDNCGYRYTGIIDRDPLSNIQNGISDIWRVWYERYAADGAVVDKSYKIIGAGTFCPSGYQRNVVQRNYDNNGYKIDVVECYRSDPVVEQKYCPDGNPVFASNGLKIQSDIDFQSNGATPLKVERTYRSDAPRWASNYDVGGFDYTLSPDQLVQVAWPESAYTYVYPPKSGSGALTNLFKAKRIGPMSAGRNFGVVRGNGQHVMFSDGISLLNDVKDRVSTLLDGTGGIIGFDVFNSGNDSTEHFDVSGRLLKVTFRTGQSQLFTYSDINTPINIAPGPGNLIAVSNNFGREIHFTYDSKGRRATLKDPTGRVITYAYDEASAVVLDGRTLNLLTSVTYQDGNKRIYWYNEQDKTSNTNLPSALTGITDENNNRFAIFTYDAAGRAISTSHAGGADLTQFSNFSGASTVVTNGFGAATTKRFSTIDNAAYFIGQDQPGGSGCLAASNSIEYDANGNVTSKTDFGGKHTTFGYDMTRNLETSRIESSGTAQAFTILTQWHADYRLPTAISEPLMRTMYTYDANGNLLTAIKQATIDPDGTAGFAAVVSGPPLQWTYTYNTIGQILTATGPRSDVSDTTTFSYYADTSFAGVDPNAVGHMVGDLQSITNPGSFVTVYDSYDRAGRVLQSTDSKGIVTTSTYTPRGWIASTTVTPPAGVARLTNYTYDNVGQLTGVITPDGQTVGYTYDAAHRLTGASDAKGNSVTYTLDNMGNRVGEQIKDPQGTLQRSMTRAFDALNRVQQVSGALQ
jgi:YD repeat-containing protein